MSGISNTKNLNRPEKSKGVLLFAFDTASVKYTEIAIRCATLIDKTLGLPTTIVTGHDEKIDYPESNIIRVNSKAGNSRFDSAAGKKVEWRNFGRYLAYSLSPYDETILLDSDYLVLDRSLLDYFDTDWDYLIGDRNINLGQAEFRDNMGPYSLPSLWATVILFRKTEKSQQLFSLAGRIQDNYQYYRLLYNISAGNFRNDYAFAIADSILNGYSCSGTNRLYAPLTTVTEPIRSLALNGDHLHIKYGSKAVVLPKQNLHILDKQYLLSEDYKRFINEV